MSIQAGWSTIEDAHQRIIQKTNAEEVDDKDTTLRVSKRIIQNRRRLGAYAE